MNMAKHEIESMSQQSSSYAYYIRINERHILVFFFLTKMHMIVKFMYRFTYLLH